MTREPTKRIEVDERGVAWLYLDGEFKMAINAKQLKQLQAEIAKDDDMAKKQPVPPSLEAQFEQLARELIEKAELIKCPFHSFVRGLEAIDGAISQRLADARLELSTRDPE